MHKDLKGYNIDHETIKDEYDFDLSSKLPLGACAKSALPPDPEMSIVELAHKFKVKKRDIKAWIILGMLRFRMHGDYVYFRLSEAMEDMKFIKLFDAFKTNEERDAFVIGAGRDNFAFRDYSNHYVFNQNNKS